VNTGLYYNTKNAIAVSAIPGILILEVSKLPVGAAIHKFGVMKMLRVGGSFKIILIGML
jgi:hypothetical protein